MYATFHALLGNTHTHRNTLKFKNIPSLLVAEDIGLITICAGALSESILSLLVLSISSVIGLVLLRLLRSCCRYWRCSFSRCLIWLLPCSCSIRVVVVVVAIVVVVVAAAAAAAVVVVAVAGL